ncbi:lysophospholipase catalytic domain-domain-containing protein [Leucosporidium creatinivorum]|uniref:Lysophospholipase n=1 Tax=Leucosporidium creatinivorum TaxID=106004 RepID=A0A1Y2EM24_9BASI|nr:lysophospholipase catalytic domain-domain-containing protein [Leucosporidium creatinivorum]
MRFDLLSLTALGAAAATSASYAPSYVACPKDGSAHLRSAGTPAEGNQALNPAEAAYVAKRQVKASAAFKKWLKHNDLTSKVYSGNLDKVKEDNLPTIALGVSGGGTRAALYGAGVLNALDGRNYTSVQKGTGGLLQATTYISGLSGGSWLLSSFIFNDMPEIYPMVLGDGTNSSALGWELEKDLFAPGTTDEASAYLATLFTDVATKKAAGDFNVTLTDIWARALSYHFLPGTNSDNFFDATADHASSLSFSSATKLKSWRDHSLPFPIILADAYSVNNNDTPIDIGITPLSATVYEFSPIEFGSYDPQLATFFPTEYLGSELSKGKHVGQCVKGFDNAGFVLGTSSMLFRAYNLSSSVEWTNSASSINQLVTLYEASFTSQPNQQLDISAIPSPFEGVHRNTYEDSDQTQLRLMDGGMNGEVVPIYPLAVKKRGVDVLIAADATADSATQSPNGDSLVATLERAALLPEGTLSLPALPNSTTIFIEEGLNTRPTFFGCDVIPASLHGKKTFTETPLIVYLPNDDPTGVTNTSTSQLVYPDTEAISFLDTASAIVYNGWDNDAEWSTCLACALVERTRGKEGLDRTRACGRCFKTYCWGQSTEGGGNGETGHGDHGHGHSTTTSKHHSATPKPTTTSKSHHSTSTHHTTTTKGRSTPTRITVPAPHKTHHLVCTEEED